jgi:hypothetical protein
MTDEESRLSLDPQKDGTFVLRRTSYSGQETTLKITKQDIITLIAHVHHMAQELGKDVPASLQAVAASEIDDIQAHADILSHKILLQLFSLGRNTANFAVPPETASRLVVQLQTHLVRMSLARPTKQ